MLGRRQHHHGLLLLLLRDVLRQRIRRLARRGHRHLDGAAYLSSTVEIDHGRLLRTNLERLLTLLSRNRDVRRMSSESTRVRSRDEDGRRLLVGGEVVVVGPVGTRLAGRCVVGARGTRGRFPADLRLLLPIPRDHARRDCGLHLHLGDVVLNLKVFWAIVRDNWADGEAVPSRRVQHVVG